MKSVFRQLFDAIRSFFLLAILRIRSFLSSVILRIRFFFLLNIPTTRSSLKRIADSEISELKKKNTTYNKFRYSWTYRLIESIDNHIICFIVFFLSLAIFPTLWVNITPMEIVVPYWGAYQIPPFGILIATDPTNNSNNYHNIMATIQATVLALIIPVTIALHQLVIKGKRLKEEMIGFIVKEAKVLLITTSSLVFLVWIVTIELLKATFDYIMLSALSNIVEAIWISINLWLIAYFMFTALNLINRSFFDTAIRQFIVNQIYPREMKGYLERNIFLDLSSKNEEGEDKKISPQIYTYSRPDDGTAEVEIELSKPKILADINIKLLEFIIENWKKRNITHVDDGQSVNSLNRPMLIFPLSPGRQYQDTVTLCKIDGGGTPLTDIEKSAVRHAFKFSKPSDKATILNSRKSLEMLTEHAVLTIRQLDEGMFDKAFEELIGLHSLLLTLGETEDSDGNPINYAIIEPSWFSIRLYEEWSRAYKNVFKEAISVLDDNGYFFRQCSYAAHDLARNILRNPSATGLNSIIRMQGDLWFNLNEWWEKICEKQGKRHGLENPERLTLPSAKTHSRALKDFIQGWEKFHNYVKYVMTNDIKEVGEWEKYNNLFQAFDEHLKSTLSFLGRSVLSGNQDAAYSWADCLMRWNSQPLDLGGYIRSINESEQALITPALLKKSWDEVKDLMRADSEFPKPMVSQKMLFSNILQNYWQDACFILNGFLLLWARNAENPKKTLAVDIIKRLMEGQMIDHAYANGKTIFVENFNDYLSSFIRRNTYHRYNTGTYGVMLSSVADRIDRLTEGETISGRLYMSAGSGIEKTYETDIVLGVLKADMSIKAVATTLEKYKKLLGQEEIADNLQQEIEQRLTIIENIEDNHYSAIYNFIAAIPHKQEIEYQEANKGEGTISQDKSSPTPFATRLKTVKSALTKLFETVKDVRSARVRNLPISQQKLHKMAEEASAKAFSKETADFPVSLFKKVEWVTEPTEPLIKFNLRHTNFPKGHLTEPPMDHSHFVGDWHHNAVTSRLYPYLVLDIFNEAKAKNLIEEVTVNSENEYADKLIELKNDMLNEKDLNPILIAENFRTPRWILDWAHAGWQGDTDLPEGIIIEHRENRNRGSYLFDICNTPLYAGRALVGGTLILPMEVLSKVKFRQLSTGYPVKISFEENADDPWHVTLTYHWERAVELDHDYKVYNLVYPQTEADDEE